MINWARVNELRSEIGDDDFPEVVELFLEETDEMIGKLNTNLTPSDLTEIFHFIKGSALNLGFEDLANLASKGEKETQGGQPLSINMHQIIECYESSKNNFSAQLT